MSLAASIISSTLNAGTPLLLAAAGIVIHEKSGVLNLGIEGIMLMGAVIGFSTTLATGSFALGFLAGAGVGLLLGLLFAFFTLGMHANQYAAGLALTLFGTGLSAFIGKPLQGQALSERAASGIPGLESIPFLGEAFFSQHFFVYGALILIAAVWWFLFRTRAGLILRAVGEAPQSAFALGFPVLKIRLLAVLFGAVCAGVAGAYLSLVYTPLWVEGMTAGRGWIALALVTFATWRPLRVVVGAYLFGGVTMLQFAFQGMGISISPQFMAMTPYLATILVLVLISRNPQWIRLNVPASLGKPFAPRS
ncbi:ABC transporter permease [Sutterella seckii]|uniref:ABC transporter permease n=1 Tax=Sutterella seckii TaxID=1944635 RepID=A0AAI9SDX4_9BURK|nr:ABC transporter permease [Sutterella seckii]KAB7652822.1 ABC transporter permease [Sutterella seckii]MBE5692353.1 ABC transporter permease [Sutterella sp.]